MKETVILLYLMLTFCLCNEQVALAQHMIGVPVELSVYNDNNQGAGNITPKAPILLPNCSFVNHLLVFGSPHSTLRISLVDNEGNIVFSATLFNTDNQLLVPQDLTGNFVVWIDDGNYMFYGCISL